MSESFELLSSLSSDVQAARPATEVSLTRVGVRGVEKVIRVGEGFGDEDIERVMDAVPVATHNQRGIGSLHIGRPEGVAIDVDARDLLHIVEQSMSSEIYELMKRSDEAAVVEKAHLRPRFVEDCVREMVRRVAATYPRLREGGFVLARQE